MFRIYYDDGHVIEDAEIPFERRYGVAILAYRDKEHEWSIWHGKDYYLLVKNNWIAVNIEGLFDYLAYDVKHIDYVLSGRTLPHEKFERILQKALNELRPPKNGKRQIEKI